MRVVKSQLFISEMLYRFQLQATVRGFYNLLSSQVVPLLLPDSNYLPAFLFLNYFLLFFLLGSQSITKSWNRNDTSYLDYFSKILNVPFSLLGTTQYDGPKQTSHSVAVSIKTHRALLLFSISSFYFFSFYHIFWYSIHENFIAVILNYLYYCSGVHLAWHRPLTIAPFPVFFGIIFTSVYNGLRVMGARIAGN